MCLSKGVITPGQVADHVEPHGGDVDRFFCSPLQTLCVRCHESCKKREEAAARGDRKRGNSTEMVRMDGPST